MGEIRVGEEINPTITVQLSGVDTESIIEQARREDNQGNRIRRVRQMLFEQLGIEGEGEFEQYHEFWWRNTKRSCDGPVHATSASCPTRRWRTPTRAGSW